MPVASQPPPLSNLADIALQSDWSVAVHVTPLVVGLVFGGVLLILAIRLFRGGFHLKNFELDEAEFGIGDHKVKLRPNYADRQLAYAIWVELSTRKVGLPIDLKQDVISDVYHSWYEFFAITRELVKNMPVSRLSRDSTYKVVRLSIELLNEGLRPHLTRWRAIFQRWYDQQLASAANADISPQNIQEKFADFAELEKDLLTVNKRLIAYRNKMHELALGR